MQAALAKKSQSVVAKLTLARQHMENGRPHDAVAVCSIALKNDPGNEEALYLMGRAQSRLGAAEEAVRYLHQLLSANPYHSKALVALGEVLWSRGMVAGAAQLVEQAASYEPDNAKAWQFLAALYSDGGVWPKAFTAALRAAQLAPEKPHSWRQLLLIMPHVPSYMIDQPFLTFLEAAVKQDNDRLRPMVVLALHVLCTTQPEFDRLLMEFRDNPTSSRKHFTLPQLSKLLSTPLLLDMVKRYIVADSSVELFLTEIRRALLESSLREELAPYAPALLALARQCHINEHVFFVSQEEHEKLAQLKKSALEHSTSHKDESVCRWLLLASYLPLASLAEEELAAMMAMAQGKPEMEELIRMAVLDIRQERELARTIPSLTEIKDDVSQAVREQYEENPYPRWLAYEAQEPRTPQAVIGERFPFFDVSYLAAMPTPAVLVAGCGTGKNALEVASRFTRCRVTAVDLSRASLAYGVRKTKEYGVENIDYSQADILDLDQLGRQFDIVESSGVLHHMEDTMKGWSVLTGLLKRGGLMKIGLYSATARESITAMRQELSQQGVGDTMDEIRAFRHRMLTGKDISQYESFVRSSNFYSLSECRDLLFHRQEHCFTIPRIKAALEELKLKFIGFEITHLPSFDEYRALFPGEPLFADLDKCQAFEEANPRTFSGMYQFWCYKPL